MCKEEAKKSNTGWGKGVMDLSYERKEAILDSYSGLEKHEVSNDRVNYKYRGKILALQFSKSTGNGYINATYLNKLDYKDDKKAWIKIKDYTEDEFESLVIDAIKSFEDMDSNKMGS